MSYPPLISVCVTLKNRSRLTLEDGQRLELFPNFVRSLVDAAKIISAKGAIELVVADFQSDDWPLDEWLPGFADSLQLKIVRIQDRGFSRGHGLNQAVAAANSDRVFLCDADMLLESAAIQRAIQIIDAGRAWFPVYQCLGRDGEPEFWQVYSYGMAAISRDAFFQAGSMPEFESWGGEDDLFHNAVARSTAIVRERLLAIKHQWHPESIRHIHYTNPRKSDYEQYIDEAAQTSNPNEDILHCMIGHHPHWKGKLLLFKNGRMTRPGIDFGSFELTEQFLTLKWDRWRPETLLWDNKREVFRNAAIGFVLRRLRGDACTHDELPEFSMEDQGVEEISPRIQNRVLVPVARSTLKVFYHVACLHHWRDVFREQMELFYEVGLSPTVGVLGSNDDLDWIRNQGVEVGFHSENLKLHETPTLELVWNWAKQHGDAAVMYVHTKGVSIAHDAHKAAWRNFMSVHLIRPWQRNLQYLAIADTVGVNWMDDSEYPHYCGNFWMARSDWIARLSSPTAWKNRIDPDPWIANRPWNPMADEMWLGSEESCQSVSLACRNRQIWDASDIVYRSLSATGQKLAVVYFALADRTDKGTTHSYIDFYDDVFQKFKDRPITLVEIGVGQGGSLDLWDRYFTHPGTRIIGVDVNAAPLTTGRISVVRGNGGDGNLAAAIGPVDIIIDDGPHMVPDQIATFLAYYPHLKPGGLCIIEDIASDDASAELQKLHKFTELDLRGLKGRYDDRILWTRKPPAESTRRLRIVSAVLNEVELSEYLQWFQRGCTSQVCVCVGFWPSLELRSQYQEIEFATMPRNCVESFGKFPWGGWLDAFRELTDQDLFCFTESRLRQRQDLDTDERRRCSTYDSRTLGLVRRTNDRQTLCEEATHIKLPDFATKIYPADWSQLPVWNLDVIVGRVAAFDQLRKAYEAEYVRFHALTNHPERHVWLVSWLIHRLDLQVEALPFVHNAKQAIANSTG